MNPSGTNDLIITIGGDLTNLDAAFEQITATAQQAFASIETSLQAIDWGPITDGASRAAQSFDTVDTSATTTSDDLANLADAASSAGTEMADIGDSAETAQSDVASLGESVSTASEAASGAAQNFETLTPEVEHAGEAAGEAQQGFSSLYGQLLEFGEALAITEGLKEFGEEALTVYANVQQVSSALTIMTKSAGEAAEIIETLETLANSNALSFPQVLAAGQHMIAVGLNAEQMSEALQDAANVAKATGVGFDSVTSSINRMVLQGTVGAKQLQNLGINMQGLNAAMGEAGAGVDATNAQIAKSFAALSTQGDRLDVLTEALQKFAGAGQASAQLLGGAWTVLGNQWESVMDGMGKALAPVISAMLSFASSTIIPAIQSMVNWFNQLPGPIKDTAIAIGLLGAGLAPAAVAVGGFALALTGAKVALGEALEEEGLFAIAFGGIGGAVTGAVKAIQGVTLAVIEGGGLVEALTVGEKAILAFTAAGAGIATAFVAWDQIKQLIQNISNLNDVLNQGVPLWKDFKSAASDAGDVIGGAVSSAFSTLLSYFGPVGDAIKSIGAYLPSFSSMWQDVKNAVNSIHWSDLIGPIGALNGALKSLADAIQLVTGHYPAMATAGTTALATLQAANDKLNASMATQASAVTTAATAVTAHATATAAATPVVAAHAQAVSQTATAANAATESFLALQPTLVQLGITSGTVVNGVEMVGSSMRQAQIEATNLGIQLIQVTGSANATGMAAGTAGQAFRNAASGLVSWSNALQDWIYPYKAASYGVDDLTEGTAAYTAACERASSAATGFSSSLSPGIVSAANKADVAVDGLTGKVGKLGNALASADNLVSGFDANMKAFAESADSLGAELDKSMSGMIGNTSVNLQPGDQYTTHTASGLGGNGLGFQDPSELVGLDSAALQALQFDSMQMTYDPQDVTQAATATQSLATSATAAATATSTLATATTAVNDATTSITIPALNALNDGLTSVSSSTAGLSSAALNGQSAVTTLTATATLASTALADTGTAAATVGGVFVQATTATQSFIQAANSAATYVASALGPGQGVGGGQSLIPLIGSVITPIIDNAAASGVGGGATGIDGPSVTFNIPINAGTVVGANGMQQLAQMVGNQLVSSLASRGIRMNRQ